MSVTENESLESGLSEDYDLPLDVEVNVDYAAIMRRVDAEDGPGTSVAAFNSSI